MIESKRKENLMERPHGGRDVIYGYNAHWHGGIQQYTLCLNRGLNG